MEAIEILSQQLDNMMDKLTLAIDAAGIGVWDWNMETGYLDWDQRMCRMFGVSEDVFERTQAHFYQCLLQEDAAKSKKLLDKAIENRATYDYSFRLTTRPNVVIRSRGKCYYRLGKPVRFVGVCVEEKGLPCARVDCPQRMSS
jgi:PAS domain-containing protein